jgi:hypothetical protein
MVAILMVKQWLIEKQFQKIFMDSFIIEILKAET